MLDIVEWVSSLQQCESAVASQVVGVMKNPPANTGDGRDSALIPVLGRSPGRRHVVHSSILVWRTLWTEEPGGLSPWDHKEWDTTEATEFTSTL